MPPLCPATPYLNANWGPSLKSPTGAKAKELFDLLHGWKTMYFHFITRPPRSPPGTNVEWCKIKAQIDCYIQSNNCRKIPICSPTLKPHEVRLYEFFSQTKIHLFVFENTVDLLCKPLSLDLVPLYRAENSAGTGFHSPPPRYHEKDIHSSNYPLPLRSSRKKKQKNTITAPVNEITATGK